MTRDERRKAISTGIAQAAGNPLVPAAVRVALAALGEELLDQAARIEALEIAIAASRADSFDLMVRIVALEKGKGATWPVM